MISQPLPRREYQLEIGIDEEDILQYGNDIGAIMVHGFESQLKISRRIIVGVIAECKIAGACGDPQEAQANP